MFSIRQSNGLIASCQYLQEVTKRVMLHHTCTVWYTMYQSALGGMVIYERFQAKVCISIDGDSEWKLQCNFFICLGVEKHNDDAKRAYFSSNKWNASMDIIRTEARIDCLMKVCYIEKALHQAQ